MLLFQSKKPYLEGLPILSLINAISEQKEGKLAD
jgi:hypothetical protein